jgi:dTDP-4-dehydrorhamnose reductase
MEQSRPVFLVTGKNGQVGWELQRLSKNYPAIEWVFTDRTELDLSNPESIDAFFLNRSVHVVINAGAYTAVDKAESEQDLAFQINAAAVGQLARICAKQSARLITVSTDYVFPGKSEKPYPVNQPTDPINYYGYTKSVGEQMALTEDPFSWIVRTSWVYSSHGHNFVKTMLRLMKERTAIQVVADQVGAPTYAADLAEALIQMGHASVNDGSKPGGIYHYSNAANISWFDFAVAIRDNAGLNCEVNPIPSSSFPTPAKRPSYSVMDLKKIEEDFQISIKDWQERLKACMLELGY